VRSGIFGLNLHLLDDIRGRFQLFAAFDHFIDQPVVF
jgi:hypothetical protein